MSKGKESVSQAEIEGKLNQFEARIDDLKHAYDMYFNGMERRPPNQLNKEVARTALTLEHKTFIQNTAQKFRLRSLVQRYQTYRINWDRILRQIEEGTYSRDRFKAKKKAELRESLAEQGGPIELDLDLDAIDDLDMFAQSLASAPLPVVPVEPIAPASHASSPYEVDEDVRARKIRELQAKLGITESGPPHVAPPHPPLTASASHPSEPPSSEDARKSKLDAMRRRLEQRSSPPPQPASPHHDPSSSQGPRGMNMEQLRALQAQKEHPQQARAQQAAQTQQDARVEQVYRNLLEAKRRCNEPTQNLSYESVARSMDQQRERLRQTHNASDVDFKVVIKSGKAYLKPEPK